MAPEPGFRAHQATAASSLLSSTSRANESPLPCTRHNPGSISELYGAWPVPPQELIYTVCRWQWKPATGFLHTLSHVLGTGQLGVLNTALALTRSLATSRRGDDSKDDSSYLPDIHICQAFARKMEGSKLGVKLTGCLDAQ